MPNLSKLKTHHVQMSPSTLYAFKAACSWKVQEINEEEILRRTKIKNTKKVENQ